MSDMFRQIYAAIDIKPDSLKIKHKIVKTPTWILNLEHRMINEGYN